MDIVLEQYRTRLTNVKQRRPNTVIAFDKAARTFQRWLDATGKTAVQIEPWELEEYLADLEYAPTTKRTHWIHIGGALRYAHRRGMMKRDPTVDVYLAPPPRSVPKTIPVDELLAMRGKLIGDRQWLQYHLLAYTGMRMGEVRGLRWSDIDLAGGAIELEYTKSGEPRFVPIHPRLGEVLADLHREGDGLVITTRGNRPVAYDTWIADLRTFAPGYTAHWFRRTVTSSLLDNGVEERLVKLILGWEPQTIMGRFYDRRSLRPMQRAILKLYADDPI